MSLINHKIFDNEHYETPEHVRPKEQSRKNETKLSISDVRYYSDKWNGSEGLYGEMWLDTNYTYDGYPVSIWLDINKDLGVVASETYLRMDGRTYASNGSMYGQEEMPNIEDYLAKKLGEYPGAENVILKNEKGEELTDADLNGLCREFGMQNINKPHVMSFDEYRLYREKNESRMGPYEAHDYDRYLDSVMQDMTENRTEYIGEITKPEQIDDINVRMRDPDSRREYDEWCASTEMYDENEGIE